MKPTERLLTILRLVSAAHGRGGAVVDSDGVRGQMGEVYTGDSGKRKWRRDLRTLRERGLIESDVPDSVVPNRRGVRLRVPRKPERLELTVGEHRAISRARRSLRVGISEVSPLGAARLDDIGQIGRILRYLEEHEEEVEVGELAQWLGFGEDRVAELIGELTRESYVHGGIVSMIEFGGYDDDESEKEPQPTTVRVLRSGTSSRHSPTRGRGMAELGFFPYSLAETEDRLTLIARVLDTGVIGDFDRRLLSSAGRKLGEWKHELTRSSE